VAGEAEAGSAGSNASKDSRSDTHCGDREPVAVDRPGSNKGLFRVLEGFPDLAHDDEVDACSGASEMRNPPMQSYPAYELARRDTEEIRAARQYKPEPAPPLG